MAIEFKKYIDIVSAVGGVGGVRLRELVGRIFTQSDLMPTQSILEFTTAKDVGTYFGFTSTQYARALFYFSFIGKQVTSPKKLSFAAWNSLDTAPRIIGGKGVQTLGNFQAMSLAAAFNLTIGGDTVVITGVDYSTATSMADVANLLQTAIQTLGAGFGAQWTACTVAYNATNNSFDFTGGELVTGGSVSISTEKNSGTPDVLNNIYRWEGLDTNVAFLPSYAKFSWGYVHEFVVGALQRSRDNDNNFGSFLFDETLTVDDVVLVAELNDSYNNEFMYCYGLTGLDLDELNMVCETLNLYSGTCVTLLNSIDLQPIIPAKTEYHEMLPMAILAATDYNRSDASQNYMFQTAALTPIVQQTDISVFFDGCRINYYGATQNAGKLIAFYQRGYMLGLPTDVLDCNTYANEIWLKDNIGVGLLNLLLALGKISANTQGRATVLAGVQAQVNAALANGVISVGKRLNNTQKEYITSVTMSSDAWRQVQDTGYWLDVFIEQQTNLDYKARYVLVYSKDDAIRKIEGSDILI